MSTEHVNRTICDRCEVTVEVGDLNAYYAGSALPKNWIRVNAPNLYFDLCPVCKVEFGDYVDKWLKHWGKP